MIEGDRSVGIEAIASALSSSLRRGRVLLCQRMTTLEERWYWDRRTRTAYYPIRSDGDTVRLVSVWHDEEITDAMNSGALVPLAEIETFRSTTMFDVKSSFRTPEDPFETDEDT